MTLIPPPVLDAVRRQHGLVTAEQLWAAGVSFDQRRRLVAHHQLVAVHRSVWRAGAVSVSFEQECLAACLARPDVAVNGPSGGRLLGLRRMPTGPVHVMTTAPGVRLDGVVVHRSNALAPGDVLTRPDGIRVLRPARLAVDLARYLDDADLESVIEQLLDRRLVSVPALFAMGRRLAASGRDGMARFARVLGSRPAWLKPVDSGLELQVVNALARAGVVLERQVAVSLPDGTRVRLDAADRVRRLGIEIDHVTWHGGRLDAAADKFRDRQLMRIGWMIVRITDDDVRTRLPDVVRDVVEIHAARLAA